VIDAKLSKIVDDIIIKQLRDGVSPENDDLLNLTNCDSELNPALTGLENTLEIFINLSVERVHYKASSNNLYYVDSLENPISDIIIKVLKGFNQTADIKQCYLDKHSFFKGAFCVKLNDMQAHPVLVALRLQGIHIEIT
jgi:hypothetical protein